MYRINEPYRPDLSLLGSLKKRIDQLLVILGVIGVLVFVALWEYWIKF